MSTFVLAWLTVITACMAMMAGYADMWAIALICVVMTLMFYISTIRYEFRNS